VAALGLTAVLLGFTAQFLFNGIGLWEKNDYAYRRQRQLKIIYQSLASDLEATVTGRLLPETLLTGDENTLRFWREAPSGLRLIEYRYDLTAKTVWRSDAFWGEEPSERELVTKATKWEFEYYDSKNSSWQGRWNTDTAVALPALVRVTVATDLGDLGKMIFAIKARQEEETD